MVKIYSNKVLFNDRQVGFVDCREAIQEVGNKRLILNQGG